MRATTSIFVFCFTFIVSVLFTKANVLPGIDVLTEMQFRPILGKRVGLLTHKAGINSQKVSTVQVLHRAPGVHLVALFGPEHGVDGMAKADEYVENTRHLLTGLPVYSLYGSTRRPTDKMLQGIDCMVIDLQDIGVRSYTYISCMRYMLEECFKRGIEVVILDRPNPFGGMKVDGPGIEPANMSYVGAFPVPYVYGLTIGELARMAKNEPGWLDISERERKRGKLQIVPMRGWNRSMLWPQTGLDWVPTSPMIGKYSCALGYAMTGLGCEIGGFRHGVGGSYGFRFLSYDNLSVMKLKNALDERHIPGLAFKPTFEKWTKQDLAGGKTKRKKGLYIVITDYELWNPTELNFHLMELACKFSEGNPFASAPAPKKQLFNKHVGVSAVLDTLVKEGKNASLHSMFELWRSSALAFQKKSKQYWIY